jgi:EmrB/QacA subfamily drug resistance transporter
MDRSTYRAGTGHCGVIICAVINTLERTSEQQRVAAPGGRWVLLAIGTGSFMSGLDSSISNTVLPVIARALQADVAAVEWVVAIYLLVVSGMVLIFGRLADIWGQRRVYLAGFGLFILGSLVCALAPVIGVLIAARAVQGLGAAMLTSSSPALLTNAFPDSQRGRVLGLQATAVYVGLAIGPSLGGGLAQALGWGAVFFVNVPIGLVAFLLSLRYVPQDRRSSAHVEPFDVPGAIAFGAGVTLLILALNQGHVWGWTSPALLVCTALAIALLVTFAFMELRKRAPMLDLSLFANRVFSAGVASALLNYMATFAVAFLLPFYLIQARGMSPAAAGLVLTAQPLLMAATAAFAGAVADRIGPRLPATAGLALLAISCLGLSRLGLETPIAVAVFALFLSGVGIGLFTSPNTSAILGAAPPERRGVASGLLATARSLGMVLGLGIGGAIFTTLLAQTQGAPRPDTIVAAADAGLLTAAVLALLGAVVSSIRNPMTVTT